MSQGQADMHPHLQPKSKTKKKKEGTKKKKRKKRGDLVLIARFEHQFKQQPAGKPALTGNNSVLETETGPATVAA
jgi:hypothetical protein